MNNANEKLYMVIDLSAGPAAATYPVRYSATPPDFTNDTCRTTEMWFRLIPPGLFMMGSPAEELGRSRAEDIAEDYLRYLFRSEDWHRVTLTQPFYIGVFQVTQKQYALVMGTDPSHFKGDTRPVEDISYDTLRGNVRGAQWPANNEVDATSFFGKLRTKTALVADLPTEAQWEYACRAGTATALNSGWNLTATDDCPNMAKLGRYYYNAEDGKGGYDDNHTKVGMYLPNAWGLYDMHGNVFEWCLDWREWYPDTAVDPKGPPIERGALIEVFRAGRGGHYYSHARNCRSADRYGYPPHLSNYHIGFRAAVHPGPIQ